MEPITVVLGFWRQDPARRGRTRRPGASSHPDATLRSHDAVFTVQTPRIVAQNPPFFATMLPMQWDQLRDLLTLQDRLDGLMGGASAGWTPAVDLYETGDHYAL